MNVRSIAATFMLGGMIAGSFTEPVKATSVELTPEKAMLITMTGIALMESPRLIKKAKATVTNMLSRAWEKVKPPIIKTTNHIALAGAVATAASGLFGALLDHVDVRTSAFGYPIDKNSFYSISATLMPLSYLVYYAAQKLSQKPKKKKEKPAIIEVRVHGDCAQVVAQPA